MRCSFSSRTAVSQWGHIGRSVMVRRFVSSAQTNRCTSAITAICNSGADASRANRNASVKRLTPGRRRYLKAHVEVMWQLRRSSSSASDGTDCQGPSPRRDACNAARNMRACIRSAGHCCRTQRTCFINTRTHTHTHTHTHRNTQTHTHTHTHTHESVKVSKGVQACENAFGVSSASLPIDTGGPVK
eukprot:1196123-Prorocentrum_minimum.AAC.2